MRVQSARRAAFLLVAITIGANPLAAELAVSANNSKVKLVAGKVEIVTSPGPDTVTFIDLRLTPPKVLAEINVPNSVVGPPLNVALTPKEEIALVASAMQIDPSDATKQIPDDKLTVIDLSPLKPSLVARVKSVVGVGSSGPAPAPE